MVKSNVFGALSFTPASLWKRAYSNVIDYSVPLLVCLFSFAGPYVVVLALDWVIIVIMLGVSSLLAITMWFISMKRWGNTFGRQWVGIRIINRDGNIPSLWKLAFREFLKLISLCPPLIIGTFWIIWDKHKQSWYDKVTKTCVVKYPDAINVLAEETGQEETGKLED